MDNVTNRKDFNVKHTEGGRIPDTSRFSELTRRLKADSSLLAGKQGMAIALAPLVVGGLIYGGYYLYKKYSAGEFSRA